VLELSTMVAGPYAGQMLGDLGADVVKIERPDGGELARSLDPRVGDESFYFLTANRNKRSLALDVTGDRGREAFLDLAESADVVLLNFPPTFAEAYGIDYDTVAERNPEVIYCSISAFGDSGPYREDGGIDTTAQALSGAMSMTRDDESPPMRSGTPMNDVMAALYATQAILAAYINRAETGAGDYIDIALLDAAIAGLTTRATYSLVSEEPYPPFGRYHNYFAPEGRFECADGDVQLSVITDRHWRNFCDAIDAPDLAADDRFAEVNERVRNRDAVIEAVGDELADWAVDDLVETLRAASVPVAPINDTLSVWEDPQVQAREMRRELDHPEAGSVDTLGFPVKYDNIDPSIDRHPPLLGEHTREVLRSAGYDDETIDLLLDDDVVGTSGN
jgi:crotonobetainyl-CoA:carnitine CoA-transferase CaiB-like acyl-CoA transferase